MANSLEQAFKLIHIDERVRAIFLTGAGRMFCAGSDLDLGFDGSRDPAVDYRDMYAPLKILDEW